MERKGLKIYIIKLVNPDMKNCKLFKDRLRQLYMEEKN